MHKQRLAGGASDHHRRQILEVALLVHVDSLVCLQPLEQWLVASARLKLQLLAPILMYFVMWITCTTPRVRSAAAVLLARCCSGRSSRISCTSSSAQSQMPGILRQSHALISARKQLRTQWLRVAVMAGASRQFLTSW